MTRTFIFGLEEFYHVYNRGTDKRKIFLAKGDYARFVALLYLCNQARRIELTKSGIADAFNVVRDEQLVSIVAYCLMPNHFHLLLREKAEGGISLFMQKLTTAYTMYFNRKYGRSGGLFESTFKARHASEDTYLKYLIAYIHLNPVKLIDHKWKENGIQDPVRAEEYLDNYRYSSYLDYSGKIRSENKIINTRALPEYFESPKDFKASVTEWLNYKSLQEEV